MRFRIQRIEAEIADKIKMKLFIASVFLSCVVALPTTKQIQKRGTPSVHLVNCLLKDESTGFGPVEAGLAFVSQPPEARTWTDYNVLIPATVLRR